MGFLADLQRRMMIEFWAHFYELDMHIKKLDDGVDRFMTSDEQTGATMIQDIPGIGNTSAQTIISVIDTDISRFPSDRQAFA